MIAELPTRFPLNVLTHSSETAFKACPRRYYLRYRLGLVPAYDSDALRIGTGFHAGLEVLKLNGTAEQAVDKVRELYANADCPPWFDAEEFAVECETVVALVKGYAARYAGDIITQYVAVEQTFDLRIRHPVSGRPHETIHNKGKIDGIARLPDGRLAIVEHKTTGDAIDLSSDYWTRLRLDAQISRYFLAARAMGHDVQTVVYDVTRKPSIRPKAVSKADRTIATADGRYFGLPLKAACPERETPAMFGARLTADIASRPEFYFQRVEIPRLERDLDEFADEHWQVLKAIERAESSSHYYRNTNACKSPYTCTYLSVCSGDAGDFTTNVPDGFKLADVPHSELSPAATENV